jgi:hypothetical protein
MIPFGVATQAILKTLTGICGKSFGILICKLKNKANNSILAQMWVAYACRTAPNGHQNAAVDGGVVDFG